MTDHPVPIMPPCRVCNGNGILIDREAGLWDVCTCPAGDKVSDEIKQGQMDILAGRLTRWEDVRRG